MVKMPPASYHCVIALLLLLLLPQADSSSIRAT
jgi:hypothetical protein